MGRSWRSLFPDRFNEISTKWSSLFPDRIVRIAQHLKNTIEKERGDVEPQEFGKTAAGRQVIAKHLRQIKMLSFAQDYEMTYTEEEDLTYMIKRTQKRTQLSHVLSMLRKDLELYTNSESNTSRKFDFEYICDFTDDYSNCKTYQQAWREVIRLAQRYLDSLPEISINWRPRTEIIHVSQETMDEAEQAMKVLTEQEQVQQKEQQKLESQKTRKIRREKDINKNQANEADKKRHGECNTVGETTARTRTDVMSTRDDDPRIREKISGDTKEVHFERYNEQGQQGEELKKHMTNTADTDQSADSDGDGQTDVFTDAHTGDHIDTHTEEGGLPLSPRTRYANVKDMDNPQEELRAQMTDISGMRERKRLTQLTV